LWQVLFLDEQRLGDQALGEHGASGADQDDFLAFYTFTPSMLFS